MLQPWMSGPPGMCQADALTLMFSPTRDSEAPAWPELERLEWPSGPIPPGMQREVEPSVKAWRPLAETRYRAVGAVDGPYGKDDAEARDACRRSIHFDDFFAAESADAAAEAVRVLTDLREQAQAPQPKFATDDCLDTRPACLEILRALDVGRLERATEGCNDQKAYRCWNLALRGPNESAHLMLGLKVEAVDGRRVPGGRVLSVGAIYLMQVVD